VGRSRIVRRLLWLRNWELFDASLFLTLLVWWVIVREPSTWLLTALSVSLVCYLLLQGGLYWHLKVQAVSSRSGRLPVYFRGLFTYLQYSSLVILACFPLTAISAWTMSSTTRGELVRSSAIAAFAALEYVNYYHYQLMHDTVNDLRYLKMHRRLRKAPLADDLGRCRGVQR
jgi:hypothetical protein